jgi:Ni,Fe-hydrogenase I large subunit
MQAHLEFLEDAQGSSTQQQLEELTRLREQLHAAKEELQAQLELLAMRESLLKNAAGAQDTDNSTGFPALYVPRGCLHHGAKINRTTFVRRCCAQGGVVPPCCQRGAERRGGKNVK